MAYTNNLISSRLKVYGNKSSTAALVTAISVLNAVINIQVP
jgi:hypothetical protein